MDLTNKVCVVTGAASGIGRSSAVRLAQDGADVAIMDVNEDGLEETKRLVEAESRQCLAVTVDMLDRDAISDGFSRVREAMGFIEILHNNAGGGARGGSRPFPSATPAQWDEVIDLNLRSVADCTRNVIGEMKEKRCGRIITTASEQAYKGGPGFTDYSAAKAGVLGFTRSLALEMAPYNVTVNAVCPGATITGLTKNMPSDYLDKVLASIPMGRMATPEEIAHAVSFFASPGASYITGEALLVAGGRTLH